MSNKENYKETKSNENTDNQSTDTTSQVNDNSEVENSETEKPVSEEADLVETELSEAIIIENTEEILKKQVAELQDKYIRLAAEYDNYRRRTAKERLDLLKSAGEDILLKILPVVDNFERAMAAASTSSDIEAVKLGIDLIYNKFTDFLKQKGIKEIEATGKDFDVDLHEAITKIPSPSPELKGKVVDVVEKGYYLNEKIIRYAKVVVGE